MRRNSKSKVILLADDDSDDRLLIKDALAEAGCDAELRSVENGEELLDYLLGRGQYEPPANGPRPAVILLDLNMPKKDGREALREIRGNAELRRIPVVVLTTSNADTDVARLYDLGANSFITKPVQFDALVKVMGLVAQYWFQAVELPAAR